MTLAQAAMLLVVASSGAAGGMYYLHKRDAWQSAFAVLAAFSVHVAIAVGFVALGGGQMTRSALDAFMAYGLMASVPIVWGYLWYRSRA